MKRVLVVVALGALVGCIDFGAARDEYCAHDDGGRCDAGTGLGGGSGGGTGGAESDAGPADAGAGDAGAADAGPGDAGAADAGGVARLVFSGTVPTTLTAGTCQPYTLQRLAADGGALNATATDPAIALSATPPDAGFEQPLFFASAADCTGGTAPSVSSVVVPTGTSSVPVWLFGRGAGGSTITASQNASNLAPATLSLTVTPAAPSMFAWKPGTPASFSVPVWSCSSTPLVVQLLDAWGNQTSFSNAHSVIFSGPSASPTNVAPHLFSDPACSTLVAQPPEAGQWPAGVSEVPMWFEGLAPGTFTLAVQDGAGSGALAKTANLTISVTSGPQGALSLQFPNGNAVEFGACVPVVLQRLQPDGGAAKVGFDTVSLAGGTPDLSLHTDQTCLAPAWDGGTSGPVTGTIGTRGSSATFWLKGHSAPAGTSVVLTASSQNGWNAAANATVTPLPLVRRGVCTLGTGTSTCTATLTPLIPDGAIDRTILVAQAVTGGLTASESSVECHLSNAGVSPEVVCARNASTPTTAAEVQWQTASFGNGYATGGVTVTHGSLSGGGTTTLTQAHGANMANNTLASSFLLFSMRSDGTTDMTEGSFATGLLVGTSQVRFTSGGNGFPANTTIGYQVVQVAGAVVAREELLNSGGSLAGNFLTYYPPDAGLAASAFVLATARLDPADGGFVPCATRYRAAVQADGGLSFSRGAGGSCTTLPPAAIAYERVSFPGTVARVSQALVNISGAIGVSSTTVSLVPSAPADRTLLLASGQGPSGQGGGETGVSGTSANNALGWSTAKLVPVSTDGGLLFGSYQATRGVASTATGQTTLLTGYAVEFAR